MQNLENTSPAKSITVEDIYDFLKANPDFFLMNADLLEEMKLPSSSLGNVTSFTDFQLKKLKNKIQKLEERNRLLIQTSLQNHQSEREINDLVLDILQTQNTDELEKVLKTKLTSSMNLSSVVLQTTGESILPFKEGEQVKLRSMLSAEETTMHQSEQAIRSDAHVAITDNGQWLGSLILGSSEGTYFHLGQGTEILEFLGKVLSYHIHSLNG